MVERAKKATRLRIEVFIFVGFWGKVIRVDLFVFGVLG
jgi:hypothetical protein